MSRMIPSVISPSVKSTAERRIFEWFRDDPSTDGWTVLHSLGIANHKTVMYGEVDFLVVAPSYGVFALEVKGGRVRREGGIWYFTNKYNQVSSKARGPFDQANEAIFSVIEAVGNKTRAGSKLGQVIFNFGAMFPDITFDIDGLDVEPWQIFDERNGQDVGSYIRNLGKKTRQKWAEKYGSNVEVRIPDSKTCKEFVNLLRADFDKVVSITSWIKQTDLQTISLTEEQMRCLDQLEDNYRSLINGAAGTGKTIIAMEAARRASVSHERTAFFCFNSLLASWINDQFASEDPETKPAFCGTFHSFLHQTIKSHNPDWKASPPSDSDDFYKIELPILALESIDDGFVKFDRIIIDEAQDLLFTEYLDVMDSILKGGIGRGKWIFLGDFSMQSIYNDETFAQMREGLEAYASFVNFKLKVNCRNTKKIGDEIRLITGFENNEYLPSNIEGPPVQYVTYSSRDEERSKLTSLLERLSLEGVSKNKITILSPFRREKTVLSQITLPQIKDFCSSNHEDIQFSTIQAFKGLESNIIILIDIESFKNEKILYVGFSRARTALYVFESLIADQERNQLKLRWII